MLTKTQISELSKTHDFYLKKRLGQNFLIDRNVRDKVIRKIGLEKNDAVLEIGPGLGALTEALAERCGYVVSVEKDKKIYGLSREILSKYKNLKIIHGDFLKYDIASLRFKKIKIVGALPYYITSPIIQRIIHFRDRIPSVFIIVQKEVAHRIAATSRDDNYGSFSLFVQYYSDIEILMDINRNSFFPKPDVDSTLIKLKILLSPHIVVKDEEILFKVIRGAFGQRRKTLLSALSHKRLLGLEKDEISRVLEALGIEIKIRAELLTLAQFAQIADAIVDFSI